MSDLISRSALIDSIVHCRTIQGRKTVESFARFINEQPSVDAVPVVHSSWGDSEYVWECNHCSSWFEVTQGDGDMNFCPNCGAVMDGKKVE